MVKGVNFVKLQDAGDPVAIARQYDEAGADELVFLDITASHEKRDIMYDVVRQVAEQCFMPFTVGGGIRTLADVTALVQAGAEKVSINTAAVVTPDIVQQTAKRFGRCATVVNIDPKRVAREEFEQRRAERKKQGLFAPPATIPTDQPDDIAFEIHIHGGRTPTGIDAVAWAQYIVCLGAGEVILTSMDADGVKEGYDLVITGAVSSAIDVPVVASGGCGSPQHIRDVLSKTNADAALAASIFHYGEYSIQETKQYLHEQGIPVRLTHALQ